jgi:hypothetical protein
MHFEINSKSSHRQSTAVLPRLLPDAKIITIPLTARELSSVLGGHAAGAEWWDEGYVIGDEAWIDDRDGGGIYIRCKDVKGLLRRAAERVQCCPYAFLRSLPRFRNVLKFRFVPIGYWVLAGFDPQWPVFKSAVAGFGFVPAHQCCR